MSENPIVPTQTYQGCECEYCAANELTCSQCPECGGMDSETEMAAYDASIGKADEMFSNFGKDYTKSTTSNYRMED